MPYKMLKNEQILKQYTMFVSSKSVDENSMDSNHLAIRHYLLEVYDELKRDGYSGYKLDLKLAIKLYDFLNKQDDFNEYYASNYLFWKTVAIMDIPEIISDRFGIDKKDHFYLKSTRVYPYTLYWYIHLSWQGDLIKTEEILKNYNTDTILQLVERTNKIGINLELYRCLMYEYQKPEYNELKRIISEKSNERNQTNSLFRIIMVNNTQKILNFRPEIYPNGVEGYVKMLFDIKEKLI